MKNTITQRVLLYSIFLLSTFVFSGADLFAQPEIKEIVREDPSEQNVEAGSELYWKVTFTEPIEAGTIEPQEDFKLTTVEGSFASMQLISDFKQIEENVFLIIGVDFEPETEFAEVRLDFVGYVENTKGTPTSKGYTFTKGETYTFGEKQEAQIVALRRNNPSDINTLEREVTFYTYFSASINANSVTTADYKTVRQSGDVSGDVLSVKTISSNVIAVTVGDITGYGQLRLEFDGTFTDSEGNNVTTTYRGDYYNFVEPLTTVSIKRLSPMGQYTNNSSATWQIVFSGSANSISTNDFDITAISGSVSGAVTSVSGSGTTYNVTVTSVEEDAELRLDLNGSISDNFGLNYNLNYNEGETYIFDFTDPVIEFIHIESNENDKNVVNPKGKATVTFEANETIQFMSATMEGTTTPNNQTSSKAGRTSYTFSFEDTEGPVDFTITLRDLAGNVRTFNRTTDESFVNFLIPPPEVLIIQQPYDVVECAGSTDRYLFVVAAPNYREFNIAYRWTKDGNPVSNWVKDFGQLSFDTLEYNMSGTYRAEMFVYDPAELVGNDYLGARNSDIAYSENVNLYVLQRPEFMSPIPSTTAAIGSNLSFTIDAHTYGEHNMENPTYWTQIDWYKGDVELEDSERFAGADASILTIENVQADDYADNYRVRLIGECDTVWSNDFTISAEPVVTVTVPPVSVEGCVDEVVQLTVEAESTVNGVALMYQWMVNGTPIANEAGKFSGANTANLNVTLTTDLGYDGTEEFTCEIYPEGYPNNTVITNPAAMITWKTAPLITADLNSNYTVEEDQPITMAIVADGENLTYTWMKDGVDLNNSMDTYEITSASTDDAGEYMVTITNDCGEVTSTVATLEVTAKTIATSVTADHGLGLEQNYPNPIVGNSTIRFTSEISGQATLTMTDMMGNTVANIYSNNVTANVPVTTNINSNELNLTSGSYFVTLRIADRVETIQISVIK